MFGQCGGRITVDRHRWYVILTCEHGEFVTAFASDPDGILSFDTQAELDAWLNR